MPTASLTRSTPLSRASIAIIAVAVLATWLISDAVRPAAAASRPSNPAGAEIEFIDLLNDARRQHGLAPLEVNTRMRSQGRQWSETMRDAGHIFHTSNLASDSDWSAPHWTRAGENVGVGYDVQSLHDAFWNSQGHKDNMLGDYNQVGIGVIYEPERTWVTVRFAKAPLPSWIAAAPQADTIGTHRDRTLRLNYENDSSKPEEKRTKARVGDEFFVGDWDGDGVDTLGVRRGNQFLLWNHYRTRAQIRFRFGLDSDKIIIGDWDGNGADSIGLRRRDEFRLRNRLSSGKASKVFTLGKRGDVALAGDWDGDGRDTVGLKRGDLFLLKNRNKTGNPGIRFEYGIASDEAVVGDWDGDGRDTIGLRRNNAFLLRNVLSGGAADLVFDYGASRDKPVAGRWR